MNERIKALAEQCTTIYDSTTFPVDKDFDYAEFARLIVSECIDQCFTDGDAERIAIHFGIDISEEE